MGANEFGEKIRVSKSNSTSDLNVSQPAFPSVNIHGGNAQIIISSNDMIVTQDNSSTAKYIQKKAKRILILSANPKNTTQLRLAEEARNIQDGLERSQSRDIFEIEYSPATRIKDIRRKMLEYKPHIVHFCGHGAGEEGIIFEDDNGKAVCVSANILASFFELFQNTLECVVLNACYSEIQAREISKHINYVIGMNESIGDNIAIEFSVAFYDAVYANNTYDFAHKLACNAIKWIDAPQNLAPVFISSKASNQKEKRLENKQVKEATNEPNIVTDTNKRLTGIDKADTLFEEANKYISQQKHAEALQSLLEAWEIYKCETGVESGDTNRTLERMRAIYLLLDRTQSFDQWLNSLRKGR